MTSSHPDFWVVAVKVCTEKQLIVLDYFARGYGAPRIARIIGVSPQAVQARRAAAERKIQAELKEAA